MLLCCWPMQQNLLRRLKIHSWLTSWTSEKKRVVPLDLCFKKLSRWFWCAIKSLKTFLYSWFLSHKPISTHDQQCARQRSKEQCLSQLHWAWRGQRLWNMETLPTHVSYSVFCFSHFMFKGSLTLFLSLSWLHSSTNIEAGQCAPRECEQSHGLIQELLPLLSFLESQAFHSQLLTNL